MCSVMLTCSCHRIMLQLYMSADHSFHLEGLFHIIHAGTHFAFPLLLPTQHLPPPPPPPPPITLSPSALSFSLSLFLPSSSLFFILPPYLPRTSRCPIPISPIAPCSRACMRLPTPAANQGRPCITAASQGSPCITAARHRSRIASRSLSRRPCLSRPGRTLTPTAI